MNELSKLSDTEILERTKILCTKERLITAKLLLYIAAFDDRRLYAKKAYPSMFQYMVSEMNYSEGAASRRVTSARLIKRYPELYPMVESGALHLSALHKLSMHADRSDFMQLVEQAKGKSRRAVEELVAQVTGENPRASGKRKSVCGKESRSLKRVSHGANNSGGVGNNEDGDGSSRAST